MALLTAMSDGPEILVIFRASMNSLDWSGPYEDGAGLARRIDGKQ